MTILIRYIEFFKFIKLQAVLRSRIIFMRLLTRVTIFKRLLRLLLYYVVSQLFQNIRIGTFNFNDFQ
jgi:hypothetical protein